MAKARAERNDTMTTHKSIESCACNDSRDIANVPPSTLVRIVSSSETEPVFGKRVFSNFGVVVANNHRHKDS